MLKHREYRLVALALLLYYAFDVMCKVEANYHNAYSANFQYEDLCRNKLTCHECIQTENCAWCMQSNHRNTESRCFRNTHTLSCPPMFTINADNEQINILNHPLTRMPDANDKIVNISPQRVKLRLLPNHVHSLKFQYLEAFDFPIDVYYLWDLSNFEQYKDKMFAMIDKLYNEIHSITANIRLGFGLIAKKNNSASYTFHNVKPLSMDLNQFSSEIEKISFPAKRIDSDDSLDVLMQAIVCRQKIGWRDMARRILIFATDASAHYTDDDVETDGVNPRNNVECHLDSNGTYTQSNIQNYTSASLLNYHIKRNFVNVIFAVTANQYSAYKKLHDYIEGSSLAILSEDASNIIQLIREQYKKISKIFEITDNAPRHVSLTYAYSTCLRYDNGFNTISEPKCYGLKVGDIVNVTANISVPSCLQDSHEWNQVIDVHPKGQHESLIIDLEMLCSCPCEQHGSVGFEENSRHCAHHGTLKCGICECNSNYVGTHCECLADEVSNLAGCRQDNSTAVLCSGRGTCLCGECECDKRPYADEFISGQYCECDNFSCERHNQLVCSGFDHGTCECGVCVCKPGWKGTACQCPDNETNCTPPYGGDICSGHGECECGICKCKATEEG